MKTRPLPTAVEAIANPLARFLVSRFQATDDADDQDDVEDALAELGYRFYLRPTDMTLARAARKAPHRGLTPVMEFVKALPDDAEGRSTMVTLMRHHGCVEPNDLDPKAVEEWLAQDGQGRRRSPCKKGSG